MEIVIVFAFFSHSVPGAWIALKDDPSKPNSDE